QSPYRPLFEQVWGAGSLAINFPFNSESICATPGGAASLGQAAGGNTQPIALSPADRTKANEAYNHWGQSISFFESSPEVSPFTSKVDAAFAGMYTLTPDEIAGRDLLRVKANCNSCHLDGQSTLLMPAQTDTAICP